MAYVIPNTLLILYFFWRVDLGFIIEFPNKTFQNSLKIIEYINDKSHHTYTNHTLRFATFLCISTTFYDSSNILYHIFEISHPLGHYNVKPLNAQNHLIAVNFVEDFEILSKHSFFIPTDRILYL